MNKRSRTASVLALSGAAVVLAGFLWWLIHEVRAPRPRTPIVPTPVAALAPAAPPAEAPAILEERRVPPIDLPDPANPPQWTRPLPGARPSPAPPPEPPNGSGR